MRVFLSVFLGLLGASVAAPFLFPPRQIPVEVVVISQLGRVFQPGVVVLRPGDAVRIVNDDGVLHHDAYVESPHFSFDSGDQAPGQATDIVFPIPGTFQVLCGIHPKMRLSVAVKGTAAPRVDVPQPEVTPE